LEAKKMSETANNVLIPRISYSGSDISIYASVSANIKIGNFFQQMKESSGGESATENSSETIQVEDSPLLKKISISKIPSNIIHIGEVQTISYSVYRGKEMVKSLGQATPRGYTRGFVTIAGTIIFTVFDEAVLSQFMNEAQITRVDQLPPLDLYVIYANEFGGVSKMSLYNVEFLNEGQVSSIQDLVTENSVNYVARHITKMKNVHKEDIFSSDGTPPADRPIDLKDEEKRAQEQIKSYGRYFL
jgi:hypothetical protein